MQSHIPNFDYKQYEGKLIKTIKENNGWLNFTFTDGSLLGVRLMDERTLQLLQSLRQVLQS